MSRRLWTVEEARLHLAKMGAPLGRAQFYKLIKTGKIPSVRVGRVYVTDLDKWLDARMNGEPAAEPIPRAPRGPIPVESGQVERVRRPRFGGA